MAFAPILSQALAGNEGKTFAGTLAEAEKAALKLADDDSVPQALKSKIAL